MKKINPDDFARVWETSGSLTEVSVRMRKFGNKMSPRKCRVLAYCLRLVGVKLKKIAVGQLPAYREPVAVADSLPLIHTPIYTPAAPPPVLVAYPNMCWYRQTTVEPLSSRLASIVCKSDEELALWKCPRHRAITRPW